MATDSRVPIITELGKSLCAPIGRPISYLLQYESNIENLANQVADLERKSNDVRDLVDESRRQFEEPTAEVLQWINEVTEIEAAAREIKELSENKRCCPNWSSRYRLSKEAVKKAVIVKELLQTGNFSRVSRASPPPIVTLNRDVIVIDKLMEALRDENIRAIGVYGVEGIGKTTLMKRLNSELPRTQPFKKVIMVTVPIKNLKRIQDEIAESLKQEETVLIVLDNVQKMTEVSELGIPSGSNHKGYKIIITARMESVCQEMGTHYLKDEASQINLEVKALPEEDSWILFKAKAGNVVDSHNLQHVAQSVMRECKGLPLTIVTVGLSLEKIESSIIWSDALKALQSSPPPKMEGPLPSVLSSVHYYYLNSQDIKLCFLFCYLFPKDKGIDLSYLVRYGIGEGFLKLDGELQASNEAVAFVQRLKGSGLLLDGHGEQIVKMSDVVRGVAKSIAEMDEHGFLVKPGEGLKEWPKSENYKRISLVHNKISKLPDETVCTNLRTLLLQGNKDLKIIPENFFKQMPALVVLDLSDTGISVLPSSLSCLTKLRTLLLQGNKDLKIIPENLFKQMAALVVLDLSNTGISLLSASGSCLTNLRTLCLEDCSELQNVFQDTWPTKLEILRLKKCQICELPNEISELTNLKILDLTENTHLKSLPSGVISKLSRLEELHMGNSFSEWELEGKGSGTKASFNEIASLYCLTVLNVDVKNEECLSLSMHGPWQNLKKFDITVGTKHGNFAGKKSPRRMALHMSTQNVASWVKVLLERTEELKLEKCKGVESIEQLCSIKCLERLWVENCDEMEYLIDFQEEVPPFAFGNLKELHLVRIPNLRKICNGPVPSGGGFLRNLRIFSVIDCGKLSNVLSPYDLLQRVPNLEELRVARCKELQEVLHYGDENEQQGEHGLDLDNEQEESTKAINNEQEKSVKYYEIVLPQLRVLSLQHLPKLSSIHPLKILFDGPSLESVEVVECQELKRLPLDADNTPKLKKIVCEQEWFKKLEWAESIKSRLKQSNFNSRPQEGGSSLVISTGDPCWSLIDSPAGRPARR